MKNANWDALVVLTSLCRSELAGRCVFYAGPINPASEGKLVEPGLYEEYLRALQELVESQGLPWLNMTTVLEPGDFNRPKHGGPWDPIHLNRGGGLKLAYRIAEALEAAMRN